MVELELSVIRTVPREVRKVVLKEDTKAAKAARPLVVNNNSEQDVPLVLGNTLKLVDVQMV